MFFGSLLCLLPLLSTAYSASSLKHAVQHLPKDWNVASDVKLDPDYHLNLRIGLIQPGFTELEGSLAKSSDPDHPDYGAHLSREQVLALSRPDESSLVGVQSWLSGLNITSQQWSESKDSVSVSVPVSKAEQMLSTTFQVFKHIGSNYNVVRTLEYSLPTEVFDHIAYISPITSFMRPTLRKDTSALSSRSVLEARPVALNQSDFSSCGEDPSRPSVIDPPCVRKLFNIGNYSADGNLPNGIGVAGYLDIWAKPESLAQYLADYIPESIGSNYTMNIVNLTGPFNAETSESEGNLDTQLAIQVAFPIKMTYYTANSIPPYIPDANQDSEIPGRNEPYLDLIDYLLNLTDAELPKVLTTSYGDDEQTVPRDYANAVCQGFAKLGARGTTVIFSSGDQGLGVDFAEYCITNDGKNRTTFLPVFPASCPYVTTVGMFGLGDGAAVSTLFSSGAGFSYYFDRPAYQDLEVSHYLTNFHDSPVQNEMYNHRGRAYPDIIGPGGGAFFDYYYNRWDIGGGTSAAAPTIASIVTLLNDWRLRQHKPTLGFLNPFLYKNQQALVDIVEGTVDGCEMPGFNATKGWDPVSGLGYMNFEKLKALL